MITLLKRSVLMLYDTLRHWEQYKDVHPGVAAGLAFLANTNVAALPDGRHDICEGVFANIMRYETKAENTTPERHEQYADLFYLLEGEEVVGYCPVEELGQEVTANPDGDIWIHEGKTVQLPLGRNRFMVFFPGDGHAPSIGPNGPAPARKCVVKVKL